jgi:hypothetical protein
MIAGKPVKVSVPADILLEDLNRGLAEMQSPGRRDTSSVDVEQFALPISTPSRRNLADHLPGPARIKLRQRSVDLLASTVLKPVKGVNRRHHRD